MKAIKDRKVGEQSELYYMKQTDLKKATGSLKSIYFKDYLEEKLTQLKPDKTSIVMYVTFTVSG